MRVSKFFVTRHAHQRLIERGLSLERAKDVIKYAQFTAKQYDGGRHGGTVYRFSKMVAGNKLTVVAEVKGQECWIITSYHEQ